MGGRIRWGKAGVGWARVNRRMLRLPSCTNAVMFRAGSVAWARCVQAQVQVPVPDLQQSGAGCFDFFGVGSVAIGESSPTTAALVWSGWWQGMSADMACDTFACALIGVCAAV